MPLLWLRDTVREHGVQTSSDVGECDRMRLVDALIGSYWTAKGSRLLSELELVVRLQDRLLKMRYVTYANNKSPLEVIKSAVK